MIKVKALSLGILKVLWGDEGLQVNICDSKIIRDFDLQDDPQRFVQHPVNLAIKGWTSLSDKLLRLSVYSTLYFEFITLLIAVSILGVRALWPSLTVAFLCSTGLILLSIKISRIYSDKIFEQTKNKPLYIVEGEN